MIIVARIIEAWRDARIFEFPMESRGKLWHFLKYPQYGLLIGTGLAYFLILNFGLELFSWIWNLLATIGVIGIDVGLAYLAFEWFLSFFRERMRLPADEWVKVNEVLCRRAEKELATAKRILRLELLNL